jgi:hypothetical protein
MVPCVVACHQVLDAVTRQIKEQTVPATPSLSCWDRYAQRSAEREMAVCVLVAYTTFSRSSATLGGRLQQSPKSLDRAVHG